jgi:hypothetical protein
MSSSERAQRPWWEPTWRRLAGSTVVLFVVILAFLVGRVRAGADPGLARTATPAVQTAPPAASGSADPQQSQGVDPSEPSNPSDPFGGQTDPNADPSSNGTDDNFGNAVPDDPGAGGTQDGGGTQGFDPPSTHVS